MKYAQNMWWELRIYKVTEKKNNSLNNLLEIIYLYNNVKSKKMKGHENYPFTELIA